MRKKQIACKICGSVENLYVYPSGVKLNLCINCYTNNIGKCKYCNDNLNKKLIIKTINNKYRRFPYCDKHEEIYMKEVLEKRKKTNMRLYGVENTFQSKEKIIKIKKTNLKKYGAENPFQSEICKEKSKKTNLKKYGVEYATQSDDVKIKRKNTNLKRYGANSPLESEVILERIKQTNIKKYGVENPFQAEECKEKIKQTNMRLYGVEFNSQSEIIKNKKIITSLKNWGTEYPMQNDEIYKKIKQTNMRLYGVEFVSQNKKMHDKANFNRASSIRLKPHKNTELTYQTKPELRFIEYCIANNIEIKNGNRIPYMFNNKQHYYFCDFMIKENGQWRLIEIKGKHPWYYNDLQSGKLLAKVRAAQEYSLMFNYLPYKILFNT